jgi:hypothetical protein
MKLDEAIKVSRAEIALDGTKDKDKKPGARRPYYNIADMLKRAVYIVSYGWDDFQIQYSDGTPISRNPVSYYSYNDPPGDNRLRIGRRGIDGDFLSNKVFEKDDWEPL